MIESRCIEHEPLLSQFGFVEFERVVPDVLADIDGLVILVGLGSQRLILLVYYGDPG